MIAAGHIGANASSRLHRGEGHHHNSIQAKTTPSATPHPMASKNLALSDIRISFAFCPRSIGSDSRSALIAAPTAVSASLSIRNSLPRANAGRRGCV